MSELSIDPIRLRDKKIWGDTGIFIRAKTPEGKWDSVDIVLLDSKSLKEFLTSRGGNNEWAENIVAILLGHET